MYYGYIFDAFIICLSWRLDKPKSRMWRNDIWRTVRKDQRECQLWAVVTFREVVTPQMRMIRYNAPERLADTEAEAADLT